MARFNDNNFGLCLPTNHRYIAVYLDEKGNQKTVPFAKPRKQKWRAQQDADDYMLRYEVQTYVTDVMY